MVEPGFLTSVGGVGFWPEKKGHELSEGTRAIVCLDCGHMSLRLKSSSDLSGLREARDAGRLKPRDWGM